MRKPGRSPSQELHTSRWTAFLFSALAPRATNKPWYGRGISNSLFSPPLKEKTMQPMRSRPFANANLAFSAVGRTSSTAFRSGDTFLRQSVADSSQDFNVSPSPSLNINQFICQQQGYLSAFELPEPDTDDGESGESRDVDMQHLDPMFEDAARLIVREQSGSTSLIQRKFAIGYNRAGRLMDQLEKAGIVGAAHGSKPREVLIMDETSLENLLLQWRG